jgi:hypothetical protein
MANPTLMHTETLVIHECPACFVLHAIPKQMERDRLDHGGDVFCPNGHKWHFTVTEVTKLKKQLADEQRWRESADARAIHEADQRRAAERSASAYKGQVTRLRKRAVAGVCPVPECHRHFANLERHMESKHPGFAEGDAPAGHGPHLLTLTEWTAREGVSYQAAYYRFQNKQLPGARRESGHIFVPSATRMPGAG